MIDEHVTPLGRVEFRADSRMSSSSPLLRERLLDLHGIISRLWRHRTVGQAVQMLFWQVVTKGLAFLALTWMVRCLGPRNLGISGVVAATVSVVSLFVNLGLDIVGSRRIAVDKENAREIIETIAGLRWRLCLVFAALWLTCIAVLRPDGDSLFAWLGGIALLIAAGFNINWALQGLEELPIQSKVGAVSSLAVVALTALFFRPGMAAGCDIAINATGMAVGLALTWSFLRRRTGARLFGTCDWTKTKRILYESRWAFFVVVTLAAYSQLDLLLVASLAGVEQAGHYRAAVMMVSPLAMLATVSAALLYPRLSIWHQRSPSLLWKRQKRLALLAASVAVPLFAAAVLCGRPLIGSLCGQQFDSAVTPFVILFAAKLVVLINGIFAWGVMATGRDKRFAFSSLCAAGICVAGNLLLTPRFGIVATALVSLTTEMSVLGTTAYFGWHEHRTFLMGKEALCTSNT